MNTEELKKYALAAKLRPDLQVEQVVYRAAANPTAILALIAEIARFTQDAEMAAASLNLITGHHEHLLAEFDRVTKERDELLAAWKEYQNADFGVSCQRGVVGKCMCAQCTNDRASAVFARAEG